MTYRTSNAFALLIIAGWAIPLLVILFAVAPPLAVALILFIIWNERRLARRARAARADRIRQFGFDPHTFV